MKIFLLWYDVVFKDKLSLSKSLWRKLIELLIVGCVGVCVGVCGVCWGVGVCVVCVCVCTFFISYEIFLPRWFVEVHLAQLIPRRFLKPAVCKYPTSVNNSEIYILLPNPCLWMCYLMWGNRVRNGSDRKPETGKTLSLKLALLKNPIGPAL